MVTHVGVNLEDQEVRVHVTADGLNVLVYRTDEGVVCDIYDKEMEYCIASTYAFFNEALTLEELEEKMRES